MASPASWLRSGITVLGLILAVSPSLAAAEPRLTVGGLGGSTRPADSIAPVQLQKIRATISGYENRKAALGAHDDDTASFLYPFFPQAGVLGQDLFITNFTDLNLRPGNAAIQDWDCSEYTYDGHHGHDSLIRTFREQAIGVPVFAALDGVVIDTHDGEPDMNTVWDENNLANYVIIDHGGGYVAWYFHLRKGSVAVSPGQTVTSGTQIGLTGSSGFSDWPHLHLQTEKDGAWVEPSAGPCRPGESLWVNQPPVDRDFYVAGFYLAPGVISILNRDAVLRDAPARAATFLRGTQTVGVRVDLRNVPVGSTFSLRAINPSGQEVLNDGGGFNNNVVFELGWVINAYDLNLDRPGTWRFQALINDQVVVDAPFKVVTAARQIANRAPNKVTVQLSPHPVAGQALICQVQSPLVLRDPDFDIVSYRYEWKVNGHLVRTVTSAGLTDLLASGMAHPKDKVSCRVTPTDGKKAGPASVANGVVAAP
ncbi:MAG TPA: M23 family metallopeptidase [Thermoanaerobaculia bacterium]|nr:M23 family metallopeptidase [Thermoanaerobaculia bacterium]